MLAGILIDLNVVISEAAFLVGERAIDQLTQLLDAERFELKNLGTRNERTIYIKKRVVSGRSDQPEISAFHAAQPHELRMRHVRNYVRERGFSGAGRTRKD